jgi:hypothetical protein
MLLRAEATRAAVHGGGGGDAGQGREGWLGLRMSNSNNLGEGLGGLFI